jgi:hypothetical protein
MPRLEATPADLPPVSELTPEQLVSACILQARLIEMLLYDIQQMLNAAEGADPESAEMVEQWAARVNERIKGAYADIGAVMRAGPRAAGTRH